MISAHLLVKMAQKPFFPLFFLFQHQQKPEENPSTDRQTATKSGKENTLRNVASTGNEALRMIFQNTEENNASFVI